MTLATNEFPMPANLRPAQPPEPPASQPTVPNHPVNLASALRSFAGQEAFMLDSDLKLSLEEMCSAAEGRNWREQWPKWLEQMVNESLRAYLGR
jgi:hypothetical protein